MAHVAKYTSSQAGALSRHFERAKNKENGEYLKFSNQDIDLAKTHLNYNLAPKQNQFEFIKKRCSEVRCHNRADINIMASWVVTAPKDLKKDDEEKFFQETYNFLNERYGKDNVISAYIHYDEVSPHMHYAFVPVAKDKKRGDYKVSAKEVLTRKDLQTFHQDLSEWLKKCLSYEISILNEATKEGNRSIYELKRKSATERLQEVAQNASKIIQNKRDKLDSINNELLPLQVEYNAKKAFIKQCDKISEISMMYPAYSKITKKLFGEQEYITVPIEKWSAKHVSANKIDAINKQQEELERGIEFFKSSTSAQATAKKFKKYEDKIEKLEEKILDLKNNLEMAINEIERVNKVFSLNTELKNSFFETEREIKLIEEQEQYKELEMEL